MQQNRQITCSHDNDLKIQYELGHYCVNSHCWTVVAYNYCVHLNPGLCLVTALIACFVAQRLMKIAETEASVNRGTMRRALPYWEFRLFSLTYGQNGGW